LQNVIVLHMGIDARPIVNALKLIQKGVILSMAIARVKTNGVE